MITFFFENIGDDKLITEKSWLVLLVMQTNHLAQDPSSGSIILYSKWRIGSPISTHGFILSPHKKLTRFVGRATKLVVCEPDEANASQYTRWYLNVNYIRNECERGENKAYNFDLRRNIGHNWAIIIPISLMASVPEFNYWISTMEAMTKHVISKL